MGFSVAKIKQEVTLVQIAISKHEEEVTDQWHLDGQTCFGVGGVADSECEFVKGCVRRW